MTETQRTSDCLKGRLPDPDNMSVGAVMAVAQDEAARARCEFNRAESIVRSVDTTNAAWERFANGEH